MKETGNTQETKVQKRNPNLKVIRPKIQDAFLVLGSKKKHGNQQILQIQEYIENNYQHGITSIKLRSIFNLTARVLERRFIKATGNTVREYIKAVQMEAAKFLLETTQMSITDVRLAVGYKDDDAFRLIFKKTTGMNPMAYGLKFYSDQT